MIEEQAKKRKMNDWGRHWRCPIKTNTWLPRNCLTFCEKLTKGLAHVVRLGCVMCVV